MDTIYANPVGMKKDVYVIKNLNINDTLTEEDIDNIINELTYSYNSNTEIGQHFGVSEHTIRNINSGKAHFRENIEYPIRPINAVRSKVSYDELMDIANLLANSTISIQQIAKQYNLDWTTINNINVGSNVYRRRELTYPLRQPAHKHK